MSIITPADLAYYFTFDPIADNAKVQSLIDKVESVIISKIGYNPARTAYVETYATTPYTVKINLKNYPIIELYDVKIDGVTVPVTDFVLNMSTGQIMLLRSGSSLTIDYDAGYEIVPNEIVDAICKTCTWEWTRLISSNYGVRTQVVGEGTTTYEIDIPRNIQSQLEKYTRIYSFSQIPYAPTIAYGTR